MSSERADLRQFSFFTVFTQTGTKCENISVTRRRYFPKQIAPPIDVANGKKKITFLYHIL